ncbi:MAG: porin [Parvibaculum sp.]|nr:porin [Parvibaculum sp.]
MSKVKFKRTSLSRFTSVSVLALTLGAAAFATPAFAADESLQSRVDDLEATIDALRSEIAEIRKTPELKPSPTFKTSSGDYAFKLRGQVAVDAGVFNTKKGLVDQNSGTDLPRVRLGVDGTIAKDWAYRVEADFSKASRDDTATPSELDVKDAYVSYGGFGENWKVIAGQQKTPNTLARVNPSTDALFIGTPLAVEAFTNRSTTGGDYKIGALVGYTDINWTASAGFFGENLASQGGTTNVTKDEGYGPAARVTYAPVNKPDAVVHLGASGYWRTAGGRNSVRFRTTPEVTIDNNRLVDTGNITGIDDYAFEGFELAGVWGPLFVQSEYLLTQVNRSGAAADLSFDGGYIETAYALTGESHPYKAGAFSRIKPKKAFDLSKGGWGAWELTARYSTLDLTDGTFKGGQQDNYAFGVNWYINDYLRFLANYVTYDAKDSLISPPVAGSPVNEGDAFLTEISVSW